MKTLIKLFCAFVFSLLTHFSGFSSDITGGDFSWTCVGPNMFEVTFNFFRNCASINAPLAAPVTFTSSCGTTFSLTLPLTNPGGTNVSQLCPSLITNSTCNGGTLPGNEIYTYRSIVTLAPPCPNGTWTMSYQSGCCRPNGTINVVGSPGMYVSGYMNFAADSCNNSPAFINTPSHFPLQYVCSGTSFNYNFGVVDPDGDSLRYSLIPAKLNSTTNVTYQAGFSGAFPIPGVVIDSTSGQISFNVPLISGVYIVNVQVDEYKRCTGEHLSTIHRDIQFIVVPPGTNSCVSPQDTNGILFSAFSGSASLIDSNTINACVGQTFTADIDFFDLDVGQTISLSSNIGTVLPGATMTTSGTNPITATISWTATPGNLGLSSFNISASDNSCPTPRISSYNYDVFVFGGVFAGTDVTICGAQQAFINATGGNTFNWTVISGDPINVGVNFGCDTCASTWAQPTTTTVYEVTSSSSGSTPGGCNVNLLSCNAIDTITVFVVPDFTLTSGPDTALCQEDSIQIMTTTPPGSYNYMWNNTGSLSDSTAANPMAGPSVTTTYTVTVSSNAGCVKTSSNTISITPPFPPIVTATANDTILCGSDTTSLNVILGAIIPSSCGLSTQACVGPNTITQIGTGTTVNTNFAFPAPYGSNRRTARHQFLFRANELNAQGINGGKITSIAFNISQLWGSVTSFSDYTIKMGCTSLNALQSFSWQGGLVQVFDPKTITVAQGWNNHQFDQAFDWDGTTNLIVEICFQNGSFSQNHSSPYTNTSFLSVVYYNSFSSFVSACQSNFITGSSFSRPNVQFNYCADPDLAAFNYAWTPNDSTITDTSIVNPVITPPPGITPYTVIVTDTFGSECADTSTVNIHVSTLTVSNDTSVCPTSLPLFASTASQFACPGGGSWQWSNDTLLDFDTISNPIATVTQTTTFHVTYSDTCGCTMTDSVVVTVEQLTPLQLVTVHPACGQNNGSVTVSTTGGFPPYQYSIDSGATWQTSAIFSGLSIGYYSFLVQDSLGCISDYASDTLINPTAPTIDSINTTDLSCFAANNGVIDIFASGGNGGLSYSIDSGQTFSTFGTFPSLAGGDYWIVVQDNLGCITFPAIQVTLNELALLAIDSTSLTDLSCHNDSTGAISIFGSVGSGPLTYSIDNGTNFQSSNAFTGLHAGTYTLVVQDTNTCQANLQVSLNEPLPISNGVNVVHDSCYQSCNGSATANPSGVFTAFSYAWSNSTNTANSINNLCAGSYTVTVSDATGCTIETTFTVTHPTALQIDSIQVQNVSCFGYGNGSLSLFASGGTPPYSVSQDGGATFVSTNALNNLAPGLYNLVVRDANGCEVTDSRSITEPTEVVVTPSFSQTTICVSNCVNISAPASGGSGGPYTYHWTIVGGSGFLGNSMTHNVCPTQNTTYEVYAEDVQGCLSNVSTITVNLYDTLVVTTSNDTDICPGAAAHLFASGTGGNGVGFTYSWFPIAGLSNPTLSNPVATPTQTTTYTVTLNDFCGSPAVTEQVTVTVNPVPTVDFTAAPTEGCEPLSVQFTNLSTLTSSCSWEFGDGRSNNSCSPNHDFDNDGSYDVTLTVTSPDGCEASLTQSDYITVRPNPLPRFEVSPNPTTLLNTRLQFVDKSIGDINFWNWNFAGLDQSQERNPVYLFPTTDTGSYTVELDVATVYGCQASTSHIVRVTAEFQLWIPKAFSPNGDGDNEIFRPVGVGIQDTDYQMLIYDRWGHLIFESNNLADGWDGTYQDGTGKVPNGAYVYKIITTDFTVEQNRHEYTGTVTIVR
ncbi:MAG: PKD domain-containing protein [Salibacteraceae bacterium]